LLVDFLLGGILNYLSPSDLSLPAVIFLKPNILSTWPSSKIVQVYIMFFSAFKTTALMNKWSLLSRI